MTETNGELWPQGADADVETVNDVLETARRLLDMDGVFIASAAITKTPHSASFAIGEINQPLLKLANAYCDQINRGNLPPLIKDSQDMPLSTRTACLKDTRIRAVAAVPIWGKEGSQSGMICGFGRDAKPQLSQRDMKIMRILSRLVAIALRNLKDRGKMRELAAVNIREMITTGDFDIYLQPIVSLRNRRPMAVEALCRFNTPPLRDPLCWFKLAEQAELSKALELAAIERALSYLPDLPEGMYMTLNAGPDTFCDPALMDLLIDVPPNRLVVELTEHQAIENMVKLQHALSLLRGHKVGIAVDDIGARYSGLTTVLELRPNVLKMDRDLVNSIHTDPAKQALSKAMVHFSNETEAFLIAEGVESQEEDEVLRRLGVRLGQGFLYGRPAPAEEQLALLHLQRSQICKESAPVKSASVS